MDGFEIAAAYVRVDADTAEADRKIADLVARLETVAGRTYDAKVDLKGDVLAEAAKIKAALDALGASRTEINLGAAAGAMQRDLADASADLMMQTALLREIRDLLLEDAAAATVYNIAIRQARDATAGTRVAADAAAASFRVWGTGIRLGAVGIHGLISGVVELAAVLIPATVAAGAWAAVWMQGAVNVAQHMQSVYTATEATANMFHMTAGQAVGLGDALQKAQDAANPQVYQALGGAVNIVNEHFGNLAQTGLKVGGIFDTFVAKLVQDFAPGGSLSSATDAVLSKMVTDLTQIGQVFGNLGHALLDFGAKMPGAANMLLSFVVGVTKLITVLSELPRPIIYAVFALHELNTWGSVAILGLGRLGPRQRRRRGRLLRPRPGGRDPAEHLRHRPPCSSSGSVTRSPLRAPCCPSSRRKLPPPASPWPPSALTAPSPSPGWERAPSWGSRRSPAPSASSSTRSPPRSPPGASYAAAQQTAVNKASNATALNAIVASMTALSSKTNIAAAAAQHMGSVTLQAEKGSHAWNQTVAANNAELAKLGQRVRHRLRPRRVPGGQVPDVAARRDGPGRRRRREADPDHDRSRRGPWRRSRSPTWCRATSRWASPPASSGTT